MPVASIATVRGHGPKRTNLSSGKPQGSPIDTRADGRNQSLQRATLAGASKFRPVILRRRTDQCHSTRFMAPMRVQSWRWRLSMNRRMCRQVLECGDGVREVTALAVAALKIPKRAAGTATLTQSGDSEDSVAAVQDARAPIRSALGFWSPFDVRIPWRLSMNFKMVLLISNGLRISGSWHGCASNVGG